MTNDVEANTVSYFEKYATRKGLLEKYQALNRDDILKTFNANLQKELMNNIILIAPPGSGKTKAVEYWAYTYRDSVETYEIDLSVMGENGENLFASRLKGVMREIIEMSEQGRKICVFIDEVHMVGMEGYKSGLEALKPILARGEIALIGATTDKEYVDYILPNEALTQRFTRVDLPILNDETTFEILVELWEKALPDLEVNPHIINKVIDYTNRFIPSDVQPRKSLKLFDELIGWHRSEGVDINEDLLDERLYATTGANAKWKVDIEQVSEILHDHVKGQDHAISILENSLEIAIAGLNELTRPVGSYIFVGPTGVGKTQTAKAMALGIFGSESNLLRYDMSEYQTLNDVPKFKNEIADAVVKYPYSIFLFDEIEKAHSGVMDLLLQILDAGRLKNRYDRDVSFRNSYVLLTTNVGYQVFQEAQEQDKKLSEKEGLVRKGLFDMFRPELLGRLDKVVPFESLTEDVRKEISLRELSLFTSIINKKGVYLNLNERVNVFITEDNIKIDTRQGGARDLKGRIKDNLYVPVAKVLNRNPNVIAITLDVFGKMSAGNKQQLRSEASIDILSYVEKINDKMYYLYEGNNDPGTRHQQRQVYNALDIKAMANRQLFTDYDALLEYLQVNRA